MRKDEMNLLCQICQEKCKQYNTASLVICPKFKPKSGIQKDQILFLERKQSKRTTIIPNE